MKTNRQSGISLIEVVITMFMIAVLLILYVSALNTVAITKKLRYENLAYHIASKQVEELRGIPHTTLTGSGTVVDPMISQLPSGNASYAVTDYALYTGMKEITVTVNWNDGINKQFVLKTLAGSGGINP